MSRRVLDGLNGANPLGFMASIGLLRLLAMRQDGASKLGFVDDGTFRPWFECDDDLDLAALVVADASKADGPQPWRLTYQKQEKKGVKTVADLKAPPSDYRRFISDSVSAWLAGVDEGAAYAAAFGTDVARDGKGNTKPTAFHFTAANQQFLGTLDEIRKSVTEEWTRQTFAAPGCTKSGSNLRWDPDAERNRALMGVDPTKDGTVVNGPLEWLAFRGLPAFPCVPIGNRVVTCGVTGGRQDDFEFHWPLWSVGASYSTVRSLLVLPVDRLDPIERTTRGVFAVCSSAIRRTAQGFGNFSPALVNA